MDNYLGQLGGLYGSSSINPYAQQQWTPVTNFPTAPILVNMDKKTDEMLLLLEEV